jgi:hypothetical protein
MTSRAAIAEVYEVQRVAARAALTAAGLPGNDVAAILAIGRASIALRTRNAGAADRRPGATRLGGLPDLPAGATWPVRDGYEFDFIGQLGLDELAPFDVEDRLPHQGLLSIFAGHDVTPTSEWQLAHRVELLRETALVPNAGDTRSRPKHRRPGKPRGVAYEPVFVIPPPGSLCLQAITRLAAYGEAFESLYHPSDNPVYPSSGLLGFDRVYGDELAADEWMLLSLADGEQIPYDFAEAVTLSFVIGADALARKDVCDVRSFEGASV